MQKWKKAEKKVVLFLVSHVKIYLWYVQSLCGHAHLALQFCISLQLFEDILYSLKTPFVLLLCLVPSLCIFFVDILHLLKVSWIILMCVGLFSVCLFWKSLCSCYLISWWFCFASFGVFFTLALDVLWSLFITLWLLCFSFHSVVILCLRFTFHGFIFYGFMVFFSKTVNVLDLFLCLFKKINLFMSQCGHIKSIYSFLWTFYIYFMSLCGHFISIYDFLWTFWIFFKSHFTDIYASISFGPFCIYLCCCVESGVVSDSFSPVQEPMHVSLLCVHVKNVRQSVWATCELVKQLSKDWHIAENIKNWKMFTQCFGEIITSFVSDKGKTEEGKEKRQTQTDKLRIKAKPCLNTREVCFRKCSQCRTMPVLWALEMGSNPRAFPSSPSSPSCVSALWERRGPKDGHRVVLSEPHPARPLHRAGLPVSLYTPGSPLFTERHAGKFISRQTLSGVCVWVCVW